MTPITQTLTVYCLIIQQGVNLSTVQETMGHAQANATARYDRRGQRAKRSAVQKLHVPYKRKLPRYTFTPFRMAMRLLRRLHRHRRIPTIGVRLDVFGKGVVKRRAAHQNDHVLADALFLQRLDDHLHVRHRGRQQHAHAQNIHVVLFDGRPGSSPPSC